jgi:hypothetical protein
MIFYCDIVVLLCKLDQLFIDWLVLYFDLLTDLLYYDYKCLCFINLLAGYYRIYGALIQGIMEKKVVHYEKNGAKF